MADNLPVNGGDGEGDATIVAQDTRLSSSSATGARRRPKACDSCYQRKIRCDESPGACRNCLRYGQKCMVTKANGSQLVRGNDDAPIPQQRPPVVSRKRPASPIVPERPAVLSRRSTLPYAYSYESPQQLRADPGSTGRQSHQSHHSIDLDLPPSGQSLLSRDTLATNGFEGVVLIEAIENPQKWLYVGKTSPQVLAKSAEEFSKHDGLHLRVMEFFCPLLSHAVEINVPVRLGRPPLIDKGLALQCVAAFFRSIPHTLPFMNEPHFRRTFEDYYTNNGSDDPVSICCVYLVIAIGARSLPDSSRISVDHFSAAWSMYDAMLAAPYLTSIQCLILMTIELMNQNKEGQAIFTIGTAIRMAQSLGMHRALSAHKEIVELNFIEKDYHLRTRVWWTCYCLDKKISFEFGRLSIINDTDCDTDSIMALFPSTLGHHPVGSNDLPTGFPELVKLCQILSTIMARLFSRTANSNDEHSLLDQVTVVDKMLLDWRNSLPQQWAADPELIGGEMTPQNLHGMFLHCTYYNALLVIHRAALFGKLPSTMREQLNMRMASAETVCLNASRSLAKCINVMTSTGASWPFIKWTTPYCINIIFSLYMGVVKQPSHWMADADAGLMKSIFRCFATSCSHHMAVDPFRKLLQTLEQAIELVRSRQHPASAHILDTVQTRSVMEGTQASNFLPIQDTAAATSHMEASSATRTQGAPFDTDLQYQDFFDFGAGADLMNGFQLWPIDLDNGVDS